MCLDDETNVYRTSVGKAVVNYFEGCMRLRIILKYML
jgi:hypothetical protein